MLNKKIYCSLLSLLIISFCFICVNSTAIAQKKSTSKSPSGNEIFEINGKKYYYDDLNDAYKKNYSRPNSNLKDISADSIRNFINMYANYRLKINEAEARGLDKDQAVINELNQNKRIVAESYLIENDLITPFVNTAIERRKKEMQIGYMVFVANPTDTLASYQKAQQALKELNKSGDFATIAKIYSDDSTSAANGGFIENYFTAARLDRNIDDAIYSTAPGKFYNNIIKLPRFGYMIVKVFNVEDRKFVQFKHILINYQVDSAGTDISKMEADSIYYNIRSFPKSFESIAAKFSDDDISAQDGGWFKEWYSRSTGFENIGNFLDPEFEKELFKLKDGELSKPIPTKYGYHIIQRIATRDLNYESEKQELANIYRRAYLDIDKTKILDKYKEKYGFKIYQDNFDNLIKSLDSNRTNLDSLWDAKIPLDLMNKDLYAYQNKNVKVKELVTMMNTPGKLRGLPTNSEGIHKAIQMNTDDAVYSDIVDEYSKNDKKYQDLVQNFRDGTLLFKIESQEVWNKLKFDSTFARSYYNKNKSKYFTTLSYDLQEIFVMNSNDANDLYNKIKNNEITFSNAASNYTQRKGHRETFGILNGIKVGKFKIADIAKELNLKEGEFSKPINIENGYSIIKVNKINKPQQMTFEEAIPEIAPIIQNELQERISNEWIDSLKKKFNFKLNNSEINKLTKK